MPLLYFTGFAILFYLQSSLWEAIVHEYFLDARPRTRFTRFQHNRWLRDMWFGVFCHGTLHHYLTFRGDYTRQFASDAARLSLLKRLSAALTREQYESAVSAQFGNSLTWISTRYFGLPVYLNLLWLFAAPGSAEAACTALANLMFATPYVLLSKCVHPYLHEAYCDAIARAPWPIRWLLRSRYGLAIRVSHFVHHRYPTRNFNLHFGADFVRRRWLAPSEASWTDMVRINLIRPEHRRLLQARPVLMHRF